MSGVKVGQLIDGDAARDAIHVAVLPVFAYGALAPGQSVGFVDGEPGHVAAFATKHIGIVDPFIQGVVPHGSRIYLFLFPGTVTGMRHHWLHPVVDAANIEDRKAASVAWLKEAAVRLGVPYEELVDERSALVRGDYINNGESICDVWYEIECEFWKHREIVTGRKVDDGERGGFTCAC